MTLEIHNAAEVAVLAAALALFRRAQPGGVLRPCTASLLLDRLKQEPSQVEEKIAGYIPQGTGA